jgi:hypothetical protein
VHLYDRSRDHRQRFLATEVINVFPFRVVELPLARHQRSVGAAVDLVSASAITFSAAREPESELGSG